MKKLLLSGVLLAGAFAAGAGIGKMMSGSEDPKANLASLDEPAASGPADTTAKKEFVKMTNQFVIPLVDDGDISGLVVMALSIEVKEGYREEVFEMEPRLRDSFLQVLLDHANIGGFSGAFASNENLAVLRGMLRRAATNDVGDAVTDVLILEIARQDT